MAKRVLQSFLMLLMLLIFMGSAGWMYTAHFCKMEKSCDAVVDCDCCNEGDDSCNTSRSGMEGDLAFSQAGDACCFEVNAYYNFPLYRSITVEIPVNQMAVDLYYTPLFTNLHAPFLLPGGAYDDFPDALSALSLSQRLASLHILRV